MASNAQKTHLTDELNQFATQKAAKAIQLLGKSLPCQITKVAGSIVTVKFLLRNVPFTLPTVTIPVASPQYVRWPLQIGDPGLTVAADAYLGGVSGLGGGIADLTAPANLTALFFVPLGNVSFPPPEDPNKIILYGPDGAVLRTLDKSVSITLAKGANPAINVVGTAQFNQLVTAVVDVVINNIAFTTHYHNVPGSGDTGPPLGPA